MNPILLRAPTPAGHKLLQNIVPLGLVNNRVEACTPEGQLIAEHDAADTRLQSALDCQKSCHMHKAPHFAAVCARLPSCEGSTPINGYTTGTTAVQLL